MVHLKRLQRFFLLIKKTLEGKHVLSLWHRYTNCPPPPPTGLDFRLDCVGRIRECGGLAPQLTC